MIETHIVNALLRPDLKDQTFFKILTFINGLVAPSFLFCAGFALAITLRRKWSDYISLRYPFWRYIVRLVFILIVGYSLHLPFFSLTRLRTLTDQNVWLPLYQSDILHVIAVILLLLVLLVVILRKEKFFLWMAAALSLLIIFTSPIIRELNYSSMVVWLRPYLTQHYKSQFPLFPWSAFLIIGVIVGYWFLYQKEKVSEGKFINNMTFLAIAGIVLSLVFEYQPITIYPAHNFWKASPEFFFVRIGLVSLCLIGLWWYEQNRKVSSNSVFTIFGQESLLVYVVHLLVVYGYTYKWSFIRTFGPTLNYLECFGLFCVLTLAMYLLAFIWHWLKGWNKNVAKVVEVAVLASIVLMFILKQT